MNSSLFAAGAWSFIGSVGGAGAVVLLLGGWLGRRWEARTAERERANHAAELERLRAVLERQATSESDALTRRREVYSQLAKSLRVLLGASSPASEAAMTDFLAAYDVACVWAPDAVLSALSDLLRSVETANPANSTQEQRKAAYSRCMTEMRRDAGFQDTAFTYKFVTF